MSEFARLQSILDALRAVTKHLALVEKHAAGASHPGLDQLAAEVRDAIKCVADEAAILLSALIGPVWDELPRQIREQCELIFNPTEQDA